ncbi:unannotated protein [freshwater metagenome]|uniref:Unannotated protein n=1 Tax=freshwater metagenome TaxID=449393 RepID=A0A6J7UW90_9ZZZZ
MSIRSNRASRFTFEISESTSTRSTTAATSTRETIPSMSTPCTSSLTSTLETIPPTSTRPTRRSMSIRSSSASMSIAARTSLMLTASITPGVTRCIASRATGPASVTKRSRTSWPSLASGTVRRFATAAASRAGALPPTAEATSVAARAARVAAPSAASTPQSSSPSSGGVPGTSSSVTTRSWLRIGTRCLNLQRSPRLPPLKQDCYRGGRDREQETHSAGTASISSSIVTLSLTSMPSSPAGALKEIPNSLRRISPAALNPERVAP